MAIGVNETARITVRQLYDQQECLNVFYYKVGGAGEPSAEQAAKHFWDYVKATWRALVVSAVEFDSVIAENLDGDRSYFQYVIPTAERLGTGAFGTPMSSFYAYALRLVPANRTVKPGSKRFVGVGETAVDSFGVLTASVMGDFNALATKLDDPIPVQSGTYGTIFPVVVGFPHEASTRYPARPNRVEVDVVAAQPLTYATTQNTRKRGRGD